MTLRCPKCGSDLDLIHAVIIWRQVKGWKCRLCNKFYEGKKLEKMIFSV